MPELKIYTLGPFIAEIDDQPIYNFKTNKVQALLIYLAVEGDRNHSRESIMELLWPGMPLESAQVNLRQTIYRLRQAIPIIDLSNNGGQDSLILADRQSVRINPNGKIFLDVDEFIFHIDDDPFKAITYYRGDFLADFYLSDSSTFEQWAEQVREKSRQKALQALFDLTEKHLQAGEYEQAKEYAWRQLEIDTLIERAYRQLMIALAKSGQRNAALAQFQRCQRQLDQELGIQPSEETIKLYEKIQADALRQTDEQHQVKKSLSDSGMPVFLLTDIEGSTRLWDQHHEAMLTALLTHNRILEDNITKHGGRILELRGDGVKAVFEGLNPLACMINIQRDFMTTDWGEIGDLKIRMGLHGLPIVRKGYDYFVKDSQYYGPVLNHTARIMDAGWGGQILVSEQVRNTCTLPKSASWLDHGLHNVKSLNQPIHIFELEHPDILSQHFPPLRTINGIASRGNEKTITSSIKLPQQATPFVGRTKELMRLDDFVSNREVPLITIVGPGGMGKTRLAIASAERQIKNSQEGIENIFPDGIFFVPLAPLGSQDQIIPTILNILKIPVEIPQNTGRSSQTEIDLKNKLIKYLQNKTLLLILDNFEHLLDGALIISEILEDCPGIQIIVTSRERLHLQEEQILPIQGLEFPNWEAPDSPVEFSAMELFLQGARRIKPDFDLDIEGLVYLTRICKLIGGMPLGLELAASWVDTLSMQDIADEIKKGLDFLETDLQNIPERHRSIRAVFESSWQYLTAAEQTIFPRFSIFRGGFSREAARQIAGATLRNLATFVNKSLLQYNESEDLYQLHELLRQYGEDQLRKFPEDEKESRNKHSEYYTMRLSKILGSSLMKGNPQDYDHIETLLPNVMEAWIWAVNQGLVKHIDNAINGLCLYYDWNWRITDGLKICEEAEVSLRKQRTLIESGVGPPNQVQNIDLVLAKVLSWKGYFTVYLDPGSASRILKGCLSTVDSLLNKGVSAKYEKTQILFFLGVVYYHSADIDKARQLFLDSLGISQEINQVFWELRNLNALGDTARASGVPREAKRWYEKGLIKARARQNRWGEIMALNNLGWAARTLMDYNQAKDLFKESLALSKTYNNPYEIIRARESLGFLAIFQGELEQAINYFKKADQLSKELGIQHQAIASTVHIGVSLWLEGKFDKAETFFKSALSVAIDQNPASQSFPLICYGEFYTMVGKYHEAKNKLEKAKALSKKFTLGRFVEGRLHRTLGWISLAEKNYEKAYNLFTKSIDLFQIDKDDEQIAWSQAGLARALIGLCDLDKAHQILTDALWTAIELSAFIPLVFILPITLLWLVYDDSKLAGDVYEHLKCSTFLNNSKFIADIAYQYLPSDVIGIDSDFQIETNEEHQQLWTIASRVLSQWMQIWIADSELVIEKTFTDKTEHGSKS